MGQNHPVRARGRPGFPLRPRQFDVCISTRADTYFNKRPIREEDVIYFDPNCFESGGPDSGADAVSLTELVKWTGMAAN
jgi:hypothetical protein